MSFIDVDIAGRPPYNLPTTPTVCLRASLPPKPSHIFDQVTSTISYSTEAFFVKCRQEWNQFLTMLRLMQVQVKHSTPKRRRTLSIDNVLSCLRVATLEASLIHETCISRLSKLGEMTGPGGRHTFS
jgi:hypothetical protein